MIQRTTVMALLAYSGLAAGMSVLTFGLAHAQPVRGLYVSGAGGASFNQTQTVNPHVRLFPRGRDEFDAGITGLGSIGWGLNNGFRVEVEGNYRRNRYSGFHGANFPTTTSGHQQQYGVMTNALFDMDIGQNWIYPYFGAGIGYGWQSMNTRLSSTSGNYTQHVHGTSGGFAYQGIFGLSIPVPWVVGLSTTMEYRFYTITGRHRHNATAVGDLAMANGGTGDYVSGRRGTRTDFNHSLMLGLRYEFNPAPPPMPSVAPVVAAPAPTPVRTYLVFFDWDSSELTSTARSIVATAARNSTSAQFTRIQVNGHTDSSAAGGSSQRGKEYNLALSLKRANAVRAELIRDGIAAGLISVKGYGDSEPLVARGPNSREPQNRRVEIDLR
ncbi:OmpA family protein [Saccharibacter sp. 17.LH.SD]|uniref:OmpA family protein n=1 Tax=Saccharibacter sp. 17.LH.SD TaxID=2689393 RepID=UPI00136CB090|nr:OmpA family protein [Saccharibacter sp. 17.LH.SD]MXV43832.1 OmpA family protein [Saccharibacter sp. 17.LH.SD]